MERQALTATVAADVTGPATHGPRRSRFFLVASIVMLVVVLLGFGPTFYLKPLFPPSRPPPAPWVYLHGAVMTAWQLLFVVQTSLVAAHRTDLHRRLGIAGAILAALVVGTGLYTTLRLPGHAVATSGQPLEFFIELGFQYIVFGDLIALLLFSGLVIAALANRRRPATHGRLIYLAFAIALGPALSEGRLFGATLRSLLPAWFPLESFTLGVVALLAFDLWSRRRPHPATLLGCGVLALLYAVRGVVGSFAPDLPRALLEWLV